MQPKLQSNLRQWPFLLFVRKCCYYYSIYLGLVADEYDFDKRKFKTSKLLAIYCQAVCILTILLTPLAYLSPGIKLPFKNKKHLQNTVELSHVISTTIRSLVIIATIIWSWQRRAHIRQLVEYYVNLDRQYIERFSLEAQYRYVHRHYDRWFGVKLFLDLYRTLTAIYFIFDFQRKHWHYLATLFYMVNSMCMLNAVNFHFFCAMLRMCKCCHLLNLRLIELRDCIAKGSRSGGSGDEDHNGTHCKFEIDMIAMAQWKLRFFSVNFLRCFQFPIAGILLVLFLNNVAISFFGTIFVQDPNNTQNPAKLAIGATSIVFYLIDVYVLIHRCDKTKEIFQSTSNILMGFREFTQMEARLEEACQQFALTLSREQFQIELCGLFIMNKEFGLAMFHQMLLNTIILVQFDIKEQVFIFEVKLLCAG